ncbi:hypothetical protein KL929_001406 [Ogataea haglerorum]|uniref:Terpene cyclase/mutase family member n=1 Tax=Ogataea haglerorum TaxID=1937702 RepID=A0ABQ7RJU6_9ASCO|nr:uncharacterized protein KL911_001834 [Ogataea haglerorum]KAG7698232.1 hypothetical protein KL915_001949 [Ogataea haglerorum]KAG7710519.1 hypothetical protein KL950_001432 [Ogataea haglerorum]KAG7721141.1 hypothetical protein KL913_000877 [Ogataea haglerorum]KAG7721895.1 hypothetical protein KL949_000873 [Ogataea haglerorum]KAG7732475.1 hypothetical protein KL948_001905 [Ogataea haglerorum]
MYYSDQLGIEPSATDEMRWTLEVSDLGNQKWHYGKQEPSAVEKHLLQASRPVPSGNRSLDDAIEKAAAYFAGVQHESGTWPNMYKGPMFVTIGYVASAKFTGTPIPDHVTTELVRYLVNTAHPVDGGWGLHELDKSTCFGTTINYVILRLLGLGADHPTCAKARKTLLAMGGATGNPHWGKIWLSVLNLYKWEGVNPAPSELFALPYWLPVHPMKWWVHTRAIYAPVSYLYNLKAQCELDPLLEQIRDEIYTRPFAEIDFAACRNKVCGIDLYYPHTKVLDAVNWMMVKYDRYRPQWLAKWANDIAYRLVLKELDNTDDLSIAPVNGAFNSIVVFIEEGRSKRFERVAARLNEELFLSPIGMTMMGTNGSQVWDSSFAVQCFHVAQVQDHEAVATAHDRAVDFVLRSQFDTECVPGSYRDKRRGAWPFSTKDQGYTVSDCSAEAMKAVLMARPGDGELTQRLHNTIDVLLSLQNVDWSSRLMSYYGSFSTYEKIKATPLLELLNPAEVFGNIMVEYPYVECTDSSILGLVYFHKHSDYRAADVERAISRALRYIEKAQNPDGSWYGCWGICYTYSGMFALEAFSETGHNYANSETVRRGCDFLVKRQLADGGWGESMKSCETHTYVSTKESNLVQTSWALIGLLLAEYHDLTVIERGIRLLLQRQASDGSWAIEGVEGVFNHSCAIEYPNYRFIFPIKALGLYRRRLRRDGRVWR